MTAFRFGDLDDADALCEQALAIWREVEDPAAVAHVQTTLGDIARERGDVSRATALYRAALVDLQAIGDRRCEASTCKNLATILAVEDSHEQSAHLFREGISLRHELGDQVGLAECFEGLAASLGALSRHDECALLLGAAAALRSIHEALPSEAEQQAVDRLGVRRPAGAGRRSLRAGLATGAGDGPRRDRRPRAGPEGRWLSHFMRWPPRKATGDDRSLVAQASSSARAITSAIRPGTSLGRKKTCPGTVTT